MEGDGQGHVALAVDRCLRDHPEVLANMGLHELEVHDVVDVLPKDRGGRQLLNKPRIYRY